MPAWRKTGWLALGFLACSKRSEPQPAPQPLPPKPSPVIGGGLRAGRLPLAALLDVQAENEAMVVAVVNGGAWQAAAVAGKEVVARLARRGAAYQLFPAGAAEGTGTSTVKGTLDGKVREECADFFVELAAPATAQGFAAVNTADEGEVVVAGPLQGAKIEQRDVVAVATVIERAAKIKIKPRIERAYHVDLDGNGKPETVLQATHPDLLGDPAKYKRQYYSLVVVIPDGDGQPAFTGYLQASSDWAEFQVLSVDSVADVDRDGKRGLLLRVRHVEGWQTQVFRYDGKALKELFRSVGGEGECPEAGAGSE